MNKTRYGLGVVILRLSVVFSILLSFYSYSAVDEWKGQEYVPFARSDVFIGSWRLRRAFVVAVLGRYQNTIDTTMGLNEATKVVWLTRYTSLLVEELYRDELKKKCLADACDKAALQAFLARAYSDEEWHEMVAEKWVGRTVSDFIDQLVARWQFSLEEYSGVPYSMLGGSSDPVVFRLIFNAVEVFFKIRDVAMPELKKLTVCCKRHGVKLVPQRDVAAEAVNRLRPLLKDKSLLNRFPDLMASIRDVVDGPYQLITDNADHAIQRFNQLMTKSENQDFIPEPRYSLERIANASTETLRKGFAAMEKKRLDGWQ